MGDLPSVEDPPFLFKFSEELGQTVLLSIFKKSDTHHGSAIHKRLLIDHSHSERKNWLCAQSKEGGGAAEEERERERESFLLPFRPPLCATTGCLMNY